MCVLNTDVKKKGLKSNIHNIIQRWKLIFKRISEEALDGLEQNEISISDDKKIEALFNNKKKKKEKEKKGKIDMERNNKKQKNIQSLTNDYIDLNEHSVSASSIGRGNADEMKATDIIDNLSDFESNDNDDIQKITFDNYDPVKECQKLRSQIDGPFYHAETIWKTRRKLWTENTTNIDPFKEHNREVFKAIPEQYYYRVYKKLVIEDIPLREPLNLEDAIKVINSGWRETKTWNNASKGLG